MLPTSQGFTEWVDSNENSREGDIWREMVQKPDDKSSPEITKSSAIICVLKIRDLLALILKLRAFLQFK